MPELSLAALRGLLPQMGGANFGTTSPQEEADMPLSALDKALKYALPFEAQPQQPRDDTVAYQTAAGPGFNITQGDIDRGMDVGMAMSGGGLATKRVVASDLMKPLTEKQFYNQYSQHLDLRGRATGNSDEIARQIIENGFKLGGNVNTLPPYRGGQPRNIVDMKLAPKAGDTVYLVPNTATRDMGNGRVINEGWKPQPHEVIKVGQDYPSLYQEYLQALQRGEK